MKKASISSKVGKDNKMSVLSIMKHSIIVPHEKLKKKVNADLYQTYESIKSEEKSYSNNKGNHKRRPRAER